jgi:hypothetical protein
LLSIGSSLSLQPLFLKTVPPYSAVCTTNLSHYWFSSLSYPSPRPTNFTSTGHFESLQMPPPSLSWTPKSPHNLQWLSCFFHLFPIKQPEWSFLKGKRIVPFSC